MSKSRALFGLFALLCSSPLWASPQEATAPSDRPMPVSTFSVEGRGYWGFVSHYEEGPSASTGQIRVMEIYAGGPAEEAGLQVDDLIQTINGQRFRFRHDFDMVQSLGKFGPGTALKLGILRQGRALDIDLRTAPLPPKRAEALEAWLQSAYTWYEGGGCDTCESRQTREQARQSTIDLMYSRDLTLTVRRDAASRELVATAEEVELPEGVDAAELPMVGPLASQLEPGDHLVLRLIRDTDHQRIRVEPLYLPDYLDRPGR